MIWGFRIADFGLSIFNRQSAIPNPQLLCFWLSIPLWPTRPPTSNAFELPVEVFAGEDQGSWAAVRAMMRVLGQVALGQ
jgi:hypothetical protein